MPLQNRVDPAGELFRSTARGTLMGNRGGVIHNAAQEIVRQYKNRQWITCKLEFKGRRRKVMTPGLYTELFFLDEAVALAAGHRPCCECRRERFNAFKAAWKRWSVRDESKPLLVHEMDTQLHAARMGTPVQALIDSLPYGSFIRLNDATCLVKDESLLLWSPLGYVGKMERPRDLVVTVLTPQPIVECLRNGYVPEV